MNEFPTPGWPFADLPAASMLQPVRPIARLFSSYPQRTRRSVPPSLPLALEQRTTAGLDVTWARHQDEVREAQRLRHSIFALEMGARLIEPVPDHDIDHFDDFCEHLLVRDRASGNVVGTYRLLTPAQAARAGGLYTDAEFDLTPLTALRPRMVELGRSCVHAAHRRSDMIMALWSALGQFMRRNDLDVMVGCASLPMLHNGVIGGDVARQHLAPACSNPSGAAQGSGAAASAAANRPARRRARHQAASMDQGLPASGRQVARPARLGPGLQHGRRADDDPPVRHVAALPQALSGLVDARG